MYKGVQRLETDSGHMAHIDRISGVEWSIAYTSVVSSASCQKYATDCSEIGGRVSAAKIVQTSGPKYENEIANWR